MRSIPSFIHPFLHLTIPLTESPPFVSSSKCLGRCQPVHLSVHPSTIFQLFIIFLFIPPSFSSFSSFSCIAVLLQQCVFHFSVDFVNFLSCLHPPPYMEVHFRRNPNTTAEKMPPLEGAVMTTPTLLLQSQLTVLAFPTPPSYTERGLWGDTQGTSLHPAGPPLVLG